MKDLDKYLKDIDEMSKSLLNKDQKELIKNVLINTEKTNKENLDAIFQLLIQRVKIGFTFDVAPSINNKSIALLKKDEKFSFANTSITGQNQNILIIGENYDALKNLIVIEREREREFDANYDLIYIDPPYNTESAGSEGNNFSEKDEVLDSKFIYRDKFSRNGWLNMINERLKLARQLLKDDGVIFVSIDDTEQAYLKVLMDEIFGENNFICNFIWQKKNEGSAEDSKYLKVLTEYVLMYSKNIKNLKINTYEMDMDKGDYNLKDEYYKTRGMYKIKQLDFASLTWSNGLDYIIEYENKKYYAGGSLEQYKNRHNGNHAIKDWRWRWSKEKFEWGLENGFIVFKNNKVYTKQYQFIDNNDKKIQRTHKFSNLLLNYHGTQGTNEQKDLFVNKIFDHPKPSKLIKYLINFHANKNARVLDFFAGSGTTGHAVLELNREDGGARTYTLVTNNENNIAIDVAYERLFRINNGIGTKNEQNFKWLKNNEPYKQNLDVFKIDYYSTDIIESNNTIIKNVFTQELKDFNISKIDENEKELLLNLTALKPQKKEK
ncbi:site-specific DNA-methyltransferase [Metamycoplasma buccale]|uniref:site-specific DNA-methyltransferase n=1 Tax=Metamycoplasma buccale TaxID=55602 RepID=UPI00398F1BF9